MLLCFLAEGCTLIPGVRGPYQNAVTAYQRAQIVAPLRIPDNLAQDNLQDMLAIPDVFTVRSLNNRGIEDLIKPTAMLSVEEQNRIRIQSLNTRSWLIAAETPSELWPKLRAFLDYHGIGVEFASPDRGGLQTVWIKARPREPGEENSPPSIQRILAEAGVDPQGYSQLQFRVEQAVRQGYAEVHVRQAYASIPDAPQNVLVWQTRSDNREIEAALLRELASYVLANQNDNSVSLMAQSISASSKADIHWTPSGEPVMVLSLDHERVRATLRHSLDKAQIAVIDENETESVFRIEFDRKRMYESQPGFWGDLLSDKDAVPDIVELRLEKHDRKYRLLVRDGGSRPIAPLLAERILTMIREYAS